MEIYAKAKELAEALAASSELAAVKEAEVKMMMDNEARNIVEEYQTIQMNAMQNGINFEDLPAEQKARVEELEGIMNSNENIVNFLSANQAFEQVLRSVNMILSNAINGQAESGCGSCSTAGSCASGSCSCSGGGCH